MPIFRIHPTRYGRKGANSSSGDGICSTAWPPFATDVGAGARSLSGGGLELALACRYLLAVDEPGTKWACRK